MKLILLLVICVLAIWMWKSGRAASGAARDEAPARPSTDASPMVACRQCGLHLPETESVSGELGAYCCQAHKRLLEG